MCFCFKGQTIPEGEKCGSCRGKKVVIETKILEVNITKGMEDGARITFWGQGDEQVHKKNIQAG